MGILYLVGVPAVNADDLTLRAKRILNEVTCIAVDDLDAASGLPALHGIATPLARTSDAAAVLRAIETGDVALLCGEFSPSPSDDSSQLVRSAIAHAFRVVPVPGPVLPLTALILSGLPADSFVFLGDLPSEPSARTNLLAFLHLERRTLVVTAPFESLPDLLPELHQSLGERPLVITRAASGEATETWRGTLGRALSEDETKPDSDPGSPQTWVLIIGGATKSAGRWEEERLQTAILSCLERGLGAKETSQQLAAKSGWPRRQVYQQAVDLHQNATNDPPQRNAFQENTKARGEHCGTHDNLG